MTPKILLSSPESGAINYENAVLATGGIPTAMYAPPLDTDYDGLILCGGDDVDPALFGQENRGSYGISPDRDRAELALIDAFLKAGKPILGICRGHQIINVALGGTLLQDIGEPLHLFHTPSPVTGDRVHPVRATDGSILHALYGESFLSNSSHHQAVDRLGAGLRAIAWSEGGLVEAMDLPGSPILCVQFHPERMCFEKARPDTADGSAIFRWFMDQCRR